jgi:hypothetical protein
VTKVCFYISAPVSSHPYLIQVLGQKRWRGNKEGTYAISFSTAHANASDQPFRGKASHTDLIVSSCTYSENFPALSNRLRSATSGGPLRSQSPAP